MLLPLVALVAFNQQPVAIPLVEGIGISGVTQGGRAPAPIDTVQSLIVEGKWKEPKAGDAVPGARGGERKWEAVKANKDGVFEGGPTQGGYVYVTADSDVEKPMLLHATGDTMVYVNGEPRAGDPYSFGYLKVPFLMKKGHNTFLFSCGRGRLQAKLMPTELGVQGVQLNPDDVTLPDALVGRDEELIGAVPVINATSKWISNVRLAVYSATGDGRLGVAKVPPIAPWSVRKVPFAFRPGNTMKPGEVSILLDIGPEARTGIGHPVAANVKLRIRKPTEHYKRTFISEIDGSVQYYAVAPSLKPSRENALILTVHGASVEALNQAQAYKPKDWCTVVAPTNRRPYGFDWEDWGRMDAMEVWNLAKKEFPHDPQRVSLTGHSMGGHGTWQLGLTYPNEFAAVGPSAGWVSFWSYAGGWTPQEPNSVEQMLRRSMNSSDTLLMLNNAKMQDIYILHGDKDDNVPVAQARTMKEKLTEIGANFEYHEQPGAGHWWGDECVDWPPMFRMFSDARLREPEKWEFTTVNPAVSSTCRGFKIDQQTDSLNPSRIVVEHIGNKWAVTTSNVEALTVSTGTPPEGQTLRVDGDDLSKLPEPGMRFSSGYMKDVRTLRKIDGKWLHLIPVASAIYVTPPKSPDCTGPFKLAFQNRFVLVVGTHGTSAENEWAWNKARFDAESWYYRGNGAVDIVRDTDVGTYKNRNLILYGNEDTNSAFKLVSRAPIKLRRGVITVEGHKFTGQDLATLFLFPEGSKRGGWRLIGVVGGTGLAGMRYTDRLPYFTSGVAYPDWTVLRASTLTQGSKAVTAAGFFDNHWRLDERQSAFLASR